MEPSLTGSAEHKALVMLIERLDTLETVVDRIATTVDSLASAVGRLSDPLLNVDSCDNATKSISPDKGTPTCTHSTGFGTATCPGNVA